MKNNITPAVVLWFLHEEISTEKVPFLDEEEAIEDITRYLTDYGAEGMLVFVDKDNTVLRQRISDVSSKILGHSVEIYNL